MSVWTLLHDLKLEVANSQIYCIIFTKATQGSLMSNCSCPFNVHTLSAIWYVSSSDKSEWRRSCSCASMSHQNCPFLWRDLDYVYYTIPWTYWSSHVKLRFDCFSNTEYGRQILSSCVKSGSKCTNRSALHNRPISAAFSWTLGDQS